MTMRFPEFSDILDAQERIISLAHCTPVYRCSYLDEMTSCELYFKCENLQRVGAFKIRGAANAVFAMSTERIAKGVATHSSGNHAQALARAAKARGVPCYVVMPEDATPSKVAAVHQYGGEVTFCKPTLESRESTLRNVVAASRAVEIHPYDNPLVIAGQGTCGLEFLHQVSSLDALVVPVGGGGLLSGCAIAARELLPNIRIIGVEPELADDAKRSFEAGNIVKIEHPNTIADGLRTPLRELTFEIIKEYVDEMITVNEVAIVRAMRLVWERMKLIIEPSAAVTLAAVIEHRSLFAGNSVGVILSGGNVDLDHLPWNNSTIENTLPI